VRSAPSEWHSGLLAIAPSVSPGPIALAELKLAAMGVGPRSAVVDVDSTTAESVAKHGWVVVRDPEGAAVAALRTDEPMHTAAGSQSQVVGTVVAVDGADLGAFSALRRPPADVDLPDCLAVIGHDPPDGTAAATFTSSTSPVLFVVLDGPRSRPGPALPETVRATLELTRGLRELGRRADLIVLPAPEYGDERDAQLRSKISAAYKATAVCAGHTADRQILLNALDHSDPPTEQQRAPDALAEMPAPSRAAWRRFRPPRSRRGLAVMFTGLSGSGKSTIARAVVQTLIEEGTRSVTLLDGDVVRRMLSAGLSFSRADRDLNILRIGFVAAEIARHGGIAVCAPIAPFAETRRKVRDMVSVHGDFLLVHVATPLEECERRDRKGLYARARAGEIPEFTGISSPYEEPDDADLVIDTSSLTVAETAGRVLDLLRRGGWVPEGGTQERSG
jgi:sulfate adenylyltransferase